MQPETDRARGFFACSIIGIIAMIGLGIIAARDARATATTAGRAANLVVGQPTTDRIAKAAPEEQQSSSIGDPAARQGSERSVR